LSKDKGLRKLNVSKRCDGKRIMAKGKESKPNGVHGQGFMNGA
jgi:hypothetical protein